MALHMENGGEGSGRELAKEKKIGSRKGKRERTSGDQWKEGPPTMVKDMSGKGGEQEAITAEGKGGYRIRR